MGGRQNIYRKVGDKTKMLKITIQVQENKDKSKCTVKMINPKDLSKASDNEKTTCAMVINEITNTLQSMSDKK